MIALYSLTALINILYGVSINYEDNSYVIKGLSIFILIVIFLVFISFFAYTIISMIASLYNIIKSFIYKDLKTLGKTPVLKGSPSPFSPITKEVSIFAD